MAVVVISGANRGIGLALCKQFAERGDQVYALCRQNSPELSSLSASVITGVELQNTQSLLSLAKRLPHIDILVNNAGVLRRDSLDDFDEDDIRLQFEVNSLGPLRLSKVLLANMQRGGKIAIITSRMGSVADNTSGRMYGYRMSKAAVNMVGMSLAQDLKPSGIAVALLHPGYVRTGMTGGNGFIDTSQSAHGLIAQIDRLNMENTGSFWHMSGEQLPW